MKEMSRSRRKSSLNPSGNPISPWLHIDLALILSVVVLAITGIFMVYSATRGTDPDLYDRSFLSRQLLNVVLGFCVMVFAALVPYRRLRDWVPILFWGSSFMLLLVLTPLGVERNGTRAWFEFGQFQLQPSEICKVAFIFALASYLEQFDGHLNQKQLIYALFLSAVPLGLILLETDVGSALVFIAITMGMLLVGGAQTRHIFLMTIAGITGVITIWSTGLLQEYQRDRLTSFIDPVSSQTEAAYQQTQAQIAIGSGGLRGQGFGQGQQTRGEFVPEQHTDFIFSVVGEEFGFVGAVVVLGLFAVVIWRCWRTAKKSSDLLGALICVGVLCMIMFQMFQSVGMTLGIMPITGIPIPFVSYGGSSALTTFIAIGLVLNVHMHRYEVVR
ncbi:MAG: rod shape-determining protein RodA [Acidimicrobiales bacterium]|nr:rod shape-determining protein RodA [Acidimicrobiales bacterium]MDG1844951.1 rod shape-determining protein RodA [Acidimicrobiales bacterium]